MADEERRQNDEKGIVRYEVGGQQITLTVGIVRRYFAPEADEVSALTFAAYCRSKKLDPFAGEAWLVIRDGRPTVQIAYQTFQKRAEAVPTYKSFKAGVIVKPPADSDVRNAVSVGLPKEYVTLQGEFVPPGYELVGGWCVVRRKDRDEPIVATVAVKDYIQLTKEGRPNRMWSTKTATMIRKTAIAHGFRDAFPADLEGMYIPEEFSEERRAEPVQRVLEEEKPLREIPEAAVALFDKLGWNTAKREMFVAVHRNETDEQLVGRLQALAGVTPPEAGDAVPAATTTVVDAGQTGQTPADDQPSLFPAA
jgi:phage recombination protein Bet